METNEESIQEVLSSLEAWDGMQVLISKDEKGDWDQTVLTISNVTVANHDPSIDDYISPVSLQLQGRGRAVMPDTEVPMPSSTYEIPINEVYDAHFDGMRLFLTTDRGSYTISRL